MDLTADSTTMNWSRVMERISEQQEAPQKKRRVLLQQELTKENFNDSMNKNASISAEEPNGKNITPRNKESHKNTSPCFSQGQKTEEQQTNVPPCIPKPSVVLVPSQQQPSQSMATTLLHPVRLPQPQILVMQSPYHRQLNQSGMIGEHQTRLLTVPAEKSPTQPANTEDMQRQHQQDERSGATFGKETNFNNQQKNQTTAFSPIASPTLAAGIKNETNACHLLRAGNDGLDPRNRSSVQQLLPRQQYYMVMMNPTPGPYNTAATSMSCMMTSPNPHIQHHLVNEYPTATSSILQGGTGMMTAALLPPSAGARGPLQYYYNTATAMMEPLPLYTGAGLQTLVRTIVNPTPMYYDMVTCSSASSSLSVTSASLVSPPSSSSTPLLHRQGRGEQNMTEDDAVGREALTFGRQKSPTASRRVFKSFQERIEELINYKKRHGHCNVPRRHGCNKSLGVWCNNIRYSYRQIQEGQKPHNAISEDEIRELNEIGFQWCLRDKTSKVDTSNKKQLEIMITDKK